LRLPTRRDREPVPVTQAMQPSGPNPSHIAPNTNVTVTDSQGYTPTPSHPGFAMHTGFPSFSGMSAPTFPPAMQYSTMPNYSIMPTPMYMPPYGYPSPFIPQGAQAMQPNGYPAPPFMMQNYPMPNYPGMPGPAPMYSQPSASGYPFAMPPPQDTNMSYGRNRQYSVSNAQASSSRSDPAQVDEAIIFPNTDISVCEWIAASERDPTPER
jgi:hypothetical protein